MPRRKSVSGGTCPVARSVDVIGDRWSLLVLRDVFDGIHRFGDIQRNLGVARNILSDRLGHLVEEGILATRPASDGTAYQEYVLTAKGEHLFPVVVALQQWGERYLFGRGEHHSMLVDKRTGKPIPFMAPTAKDGTVLVPAATEVRQK
ncbi:winged helix-turn-helix transcriptional regulator [Paraburkholderia lycopersici]|uniref:DNA-binding transcriptional regulator, HxlR family n=1 Tax=Paraburkholderia lycopersici TaxID=416944 RepID=A0A1G6H9H9_9BURK|nr:helix-turn-helix domain-containing protein [Paraburkholderia lycopersici]SDB90947.1 DNA-binding transcriptional regulator, HxlR family [Paraburkholderia lycopersici]